MTLSVVIPTHKRPGSLLRLINSLFHQDCKDEQLQVLVVSNFRDRKLEDLSLKWEDWFYDFKLLVTGEKGVNKARNLGLRFAFGDIVYFLDDDCVLNGSDHLTKIINFHQKYKDAAGVGGGYITQGPIHLSKGFYLNQAKEWMRKSLKTGSFASQLPGGNSSYKREVFDKGFYYDSEIVFGGSEESFNRALCDNGYSLMFFNELDVIHGPSLSLFIVSKKAFFQGAGAFENRYKQGQPLQSLIDMSREGMMTSKDTRDTEALLYHFFFKMGYFWKASKRVRTFLPFRMIYFFGLILKSRWVVWRLGERMWWPLAWIGYKFPIVKIYVQRIGIRIKWLLVASVWRFFGKVWWFLGMYVWQPLWRFFGRVWWFLGMYVWRPLVWFKIYVWRMGYIIKMYIWQPFKWLCNDVWWWFFGIVWWFLGMYVWRPLVWTWYKSPFMKIYYFSRYQFLTRLIPFYRKWILKKNG